MIDLANQTTESMLFVGTVPRAISSPTDEESSITKRGTDDCHEACGKSYTPERQHEDLDSACVGGIMAVVISRNGAPARGGREADGHERKEGACKSETCVKTWGVGVNVL